MGSKYHYRGATTKNGGIECLLTHSIDGKKKQAPAAGGAASTARRDLLLSIQEQSQARWEAEKVFESDAPGEGKRE